MKWYKRLSNGLIAIIVVAVVAILVFVATAIIVPKLNKNKAGDGFFVKMFKDPPRNEHIYVDQDRLTGAITLKVDAQTDYDYLEINLKLVVPNDEHRYFDFDTISYVDDSGYKRKEQFTFTAENFKKGSNTFAQTYQPSKSTLENYKKYEIIIEVVKYR